MKRDVTIICNNISFPFVNLSIQSKHATIVPRISLFLCRASYVNLAEQAVIWTHDYYVKGMGLFSILHHKLFAFLFSIESNFSLQRAPSFKGKIENGPMTAAGFDNIAHLARQIKSEILR